MDSNLNVFMRIISFFRARSLRDKVMLLVAAGILALAFYGACSIGVIRAVGDYQESLSKSESYYVDIILDSFDKLVDEWIGACEGDLAHMIDGGSFDETEAAAIEQGNLDAVFDYFADHSLLEDNGLLFACELPSGAIVCSDSLKDAGVTEKEIARTIEKGGCICVSEEGTPFLMVAKSSPQGLNYIALVPFAPLFDLLGMQSDLEEYQVIFHDDRSGYFIFQDNYSIVAQRNPSDEYLGSKGLYFMMMTENGLGFYSNTYYSKYQESDRNYLSRIHTKPRADTVNQHLTLGVSMNLNALSSAPEGVVGGITVAAIATCLFLVFIIALVFMFVRRHFANLEEIDQLKKRNDELTNLRDQMNENIHHQRLEVMGTMTSGVAHEFNNLLTPIMGYSIMALEEVRASEIENEDLVDCLTEIYSTSERAKGLVRRVSDLSRKNSDTTMEPVRVDDLVSEQVKSLHMLMSDTLVVRRELNAPGAVIIANSFQISQMLLNLLINAAHAVQSREDGTGEIVVSTWVEGKKVCMSIKDNGPGIPLEMQNRIYDPFFTTKNPGSGTGLGLAIVMQVVEEHKGTIDLESQPGEGACFTVCFALADGDYNKE